MECFGPALQYYSNKASTSEWKAGRQAMHDWGKLVYLQSLSAASGKTVAHSRFRSKAEKNRHEKYMLPITHKSPTHLWQQKMTREWAKDL